MSEIDVSKCKDSEKATCFDNDFDEIEFDYCKLFDESCEDVRNNNRCTYKLKQQIQQLKAENKELKKLNKMLSENNAVQQWADMYNKKDKDHFDCQLKLAIAEQKLEKIKEYLTNYIQGRVVQPDHILRIIEGEE